MFIWVKFQNLRNPFKIRFQQLPWIVYKLYNKINVDGQTLPFCTNFAPVIVYLNVIYFSLNMGYNICNIHTQYINMLMKLYVAVNGTVLVCTPVTSFVFVFILMIGIWLFVVVTIFYIIFYSRHMNIFVFALFRIISFRLFFIFNACQQDLVVRVLVQRSMLLSLGLFRLCLNDSFLSIERIF